MWLILKLLNWFRIPFWKISFVWFLNLLNVSIKIFSDKWSLPIFVKRVCVGFNFNNDRSDSSASRIHNLLFPTLIFPRLSSFFQFIKLAPLYTVGFNPADSKIHANKPVVVVFPAVPVIAIISASSGIRILRKSILWRVSIFSSRAFSKSGLFF